MKSDNEDTIIEIAHNVFTILAFLVVVFVWVVELIGEPRMVIERSGPPTVIVQPR